MLKKHKGTSKDKNGVVFNYTCYSGNGETQYHVEDAHGKTLVVGPTLENVKIQLANAQ